MNLHTARRITATFAHSDTVTDWEAFNFVVQTNPERHHFKIGHEEEEIRELIASADYHQVNWSRLCGCAIPPSEPKNLRCPVCQAKLNAQAHAFDAPVGARR